MSWSTAALAAALSVLAAACSRDHSQKLVITGSSTVAPLVAELGKAFEARHDGARIDVQTGGSSRGITDAREGVADIGMVSRALRGDEADLVAHTIAKDGIALIVHADNAVRALTEAQVVGIYTGAIRNWRDVGGADAPITVVNKAEGRSTLELFFAHFGLRNDAIRADVVIGDNEQGVKTVAGNPHAIGYVSIGTAEYDAAHGVPIAALPLDGVAASTEAVRAGRFPLSRELNLVTRGPPSGLAQEFIDFARSEAAHDVIVRQYFVPIAP